MYFIFTNAKDYSFSEYHIVQYVFNMYIELQE